ncbi:hypothetical protein UFOVP755_27 [uncultured Caudovirales phage]|uniref:Uncharacterized protein n=1 Tax=uncultured Caudovirales phage TaxID=2100421 RepID=A0A6J7X556_9CAUD|nr:hypothetical protein UFOVP755_27 [uncultured Caudovirales phage]
MLKRLKKRFTIDFSKSEVMLFENQTILIKAPNAKYHGNMCTVRYMGDREQSAKILFTRAEYEREEITLGNTGISEVVIIVNSKKNLPYRSYFIFTNYLDKENKLYRSRHTYYVYDRYNPTVKYLKNRLTDETILIGDTKKPTQEEQIVPQVHKKKSIFKRLNK